VTLVVFGFLVYYIVSHNTMQDLKGKLVDQDRSIQVANTFTGLAMAPINRFDPSIGVQLISFIGDDKKGYITDQSPSLANSNGFTFPIPAFDKIDFKYRFIKYMIDGKPYYVLEHPVTASRSNETVGLLQIGAYMGSEEGFLAQLRQIFWLAGSIGVIVAFVLGMFLSRKALQPIEQVTEAAQQIQSGSDLSIRIPGDSQDEIGRLRNTLNHMLERIERAYKGLEETNIAQRRFVSDASHELRTPLTTIRGNVDFLEKIWAQPENAGAEHAESGPAGGEARTLSSEERETISREALHDIADEARRMSRLVNDLLALARADSGYVVDKEPVCLKPLAEEAARRAAFLPRTAEWKVGSLDALDGVWVQGNRDYLLQLLFIFIENGFKYTPSGEVRLEALRAGDKIGLMVADTGIGMSKEEVPHIFDRFYRVDVSRGQTQGTGLGLSIAKWIAEMHNATLEVRTKLGEGTRFIVWLPIDFSPSPEYGIMEASARPELPSREN